MALLAQGNLLYLNKKYPAEVPGDPRTYAHYFVTPIDLSTLSQPVIHGAINVPGELIAVHCATPVTRSGARSSSRPRSRRSRSRAG